MSAQLRLPTSGAGAALCVAAALLLATPALARHRLEPADGRIIHGGGSGETDFRPYAAFMNASAPMAYMTYLGVDSLNNTEPGVVAKWFTDLNATLNSYGSNNASEWFMVPQIGLSLPHDGKEEKIADGSYDPALRALVTGLAALGRPVFMRIGYEFNGPWNGYKPDSYRDAFKRITEFVRNNTVTNTTVATIWDRTCDDANSDKDFYPGDDHVDWWAVNIYSDGSDPNDKGCVLDFVDRAAKAGFPVALGEVAPRSKFTNHSSTWDEWFKPYFDDLIGKNTNVKLTSYIDREWWKNKSYRTWGDSRVEAGVASGVAGNYTERMQDSRWLNRAGKAAVLEALGLPPDVL